ncbi:MAG: flippase-like domain-containing protein [Lentisphaerae bacterium]|nr:flippase-like domain-containing protein [Lentisphaerota bacterium]
MLIKAALAVGIIVILLRHSGVKSENFTGLRPVWLVAAFAAVLAQNLLTGIRWWYLLRAAGVKVSLFDAVSLTMQGLFFTLFIPGGSVSGDVVKGALIAGKTGEGHKFDAVFSILIDRLCGLCGLFILSLLAALLALLQPVKWPEFFADMLYVVVAAAPVFLLCFVAAFRCDIILKVAFFKKLYDLANRLTRGGISRIEQALAAYRPAWKTVVAWTLLSGFAAFPLIVLAVWLIAVAALGISGSCDSGVVIGSLLSGSIGELAGILPLTPGGIGVRDAVFVEIFKACGLPGAASAVIPIVFTTLFVLASSTGALFALYMLWAGKKHPGKK